MSKDTASVLEWAKFIVGAIFFACMLYFHVYVKELHILLLAMPGLLMGIDPTKFIGGGKR